MPNVFVNEDSLSDIADAIRSKLNVQTTYKPGEMAAAIESISGGGSSLGTKSITANGTYNASSDSLDGYSQVTVNVPTGTEKSSSDLTANNLTVTAPAGLYSSDASKTLMDANLTAGNIKKDVTIFGVTGSYEGGGGGSGITKETVEFTVESNTYATNVSVTGDVSKALFAHWYDTDAVYTTNNTSYEGIIGGPALIKLSAILSGGHWNFWRTNSTGGTTGWYQYSTGATPFATTGVVGVRANPMLIAGHTYVLDVFYAP